MRAGPGIPCLLFVLLVACHKDNSGELPPEQIRTIRASELGRDFFVPSGVWDRISGRKLTTVQETGTVSFLPIKVVFDEKNRGVLQQKRVVAEFPKGGGDLDLSQVVGEKTGTFYMKFEFEGFADPENLQVYFVNAAKKTKVDGEIRGDGCDKAYDIKAFVLNNLKKGIEVNTYKNLHLYLLGGHFVFSSQVKGQTLVTQVSMTDTSKSYVFCENLLQKRRLKDPS